MQPIVGPDGINLTPETIIPAVAVGMIIGILGLLARRFLMAAAIELMDLWHEYSPIAARRVMDQRPNMPATPWFCLRCHSRNGEAASVCYKCGGSRVEHETPVPDADLPVGAGAGRTMRNRR